MIKRSGVQIQAPITKWNIFHNISYKNWIALLKDLKQRTKAMLKIRVFKELDNRY